MQCTKWFTACGPLEGNVVHCYCRLIHSYVTCGFRDQLDCDSRLAIMNFVLGTRGKRRHGIARTACCQTWFVPILFLARPSFFVFFILFL
jgi:hypothetical protein